MILFFLALAFLLLLVLLFTFLVYRLCFYSPDKTQNDHYFELEGEQYKECREETVRMIKAMENRPFEWVSVTSFDGLTLYGRYYAKDPNAPLVIAFHGYRGTELRDFCGGADVILSKGWNLILIEERGCCRSGGHTISFGINEKKDLLSWVTYAQERFGKEKSLFLMGISMGGATVVMASGLELPSAVKGIIADCPYSSPYDIIRKVAVEDYHLPFFPSMALVLMAARLFGGFDLKKAESAAEAVKRTKVPVLVIHGLDDRFVPASMSEEIVNANPRMVQRETFPTAGHGLSYMKDKTRYWRLANEFLDRNC